MSKNEDQIVNTNHEFLFIYDAKLCNPNGDPDNENKPRMDDEREINLVSDVRLKRYIRDYFQSYKKKRIYVSKIDDKPVQPQEILDALEKDKDKLEFQDMKNKEHFYLENLIDVRMFGATMAIKDFSRAFTGPIQMNWGYSLNPVSLNESNGITTTFKSSEKAKQSSMGNDYRVNYSMIAFYGNIIARKCRYTHLKHDDITLFDEAIIESIPLLATRSKIGQYPRLYIRLEYNDPQYLYGDLRKLISLDSIDPEKIKIENIRDISEVVLDVSRFEKVLDMLKNEKVKTGDQEKPLVKNAYYWQSKDLQLKGELNERIS